MTVRSLPIASGVRGGNSSNEKLSFDFKRVSLESNSNHQGTHSLFPIPCFVTTDH